MHTHFTLDRNSQGSSLWHHLDPRSRILCAVFMVFAIALTPNGHWETWGFYGVSIALLIALSQVSIGILCQRLMVESAFIVVICVGTLFHSGGTVLWHWGPLQVTTAGLTLLTSVTLKAILSLTVLNLLTLTTPIAALLQALKTLRVSPLLIAILSSMYRYLGVLLTEFTTMQQAAHSRNLTLGSPAHYRLVFGNLIGSLFLRTYDRGERVYQAMLARGYTGTPPQQTPLPLRTNDRIALGIMAMVLVTGQALNWLF